MANWKQPIPTNIEEQFGDDLIVFALYVFLIYKAYNEDTQVLSGGKFISVKRGQTVFGRNLWCKYFHLSPSGIEKILKRLEKVPSKVTCERSRNCTIVTILNYDEIVGMNKQSNKQVTSEYQASNTPKILESVKSDKKKKVIKEKFSTLKSFEENISEARSSLIEKFPPAVVDRVLPLFVDGCRSKGYKYRDYLAAVRNWIRSEIGKQTKFTGMPQL